MSGNQSALFGGGTPPKWVSGTFSEGYVAWSPTDYQYYMNKTTGSRATDPASDPTNWQPTGDRAIKSIQRGRLSITNTTTTATVSSVVTAKSELRMLGFSSNGTDNTSSADIALTNSTTITGTKVSAGINTTASWELIERY